MEHSYSSLSDVRKSLKISWYRVPLDAKDLKKLTQRSNLKGSLQAFGHLFLFLATGSLAYWMWLESLWILFAVALFCHGTVSSFFVGASNHELGHGTVFKTKWLNRFFLHLFSTIGWWNHYDYAMSHTYHHRYTLHPEGDREVVLPLEPSLSFVTMLKLFTINVFSRPYRTFSKGGFVNAIFDTTRAALGIPPQRNTPRNEWLYSLHQDQPKQARKSTLWSRWLILFHAAVFLVSILTGQWVFFLLISVAAFTANWAVFATALSQHCGLVDNSSDFRKNSRSIRLDPVLEFLYWHMNWHIEHHMYAAVPCYNLKKLSKILEPDLPERKTLLSAWKEMRHTWIRQLTDSEYQFDVPVPSKPEANKTSKLPGDIESSIGELAPEELS